MPLARVTVTVAVLVGVVSGCATVSYGDKSAEAQLREFQPIPGKTSLYVCREAAAFFGAGNRTTAIVNGRSIGTLKPNNFAHAVVEPGQQDVYLKLNPGGNSGILTVRTEPGEVAIIWAGATGGGLGVLTVDNFRSKREGEQCVRGAEYAVPAEAALPR